MTTETVEPAPTETNLTQIGIPKEEPRVSDELKAKVHTYRGFAECHNLLAAGNFSLNQFQAVANALVFLKALHEQAVKAACADKGAWLVPELKEFMEKKKAADAQASKTAAPEAPNGTT